MRKKTLKSKLISAALKVVMVLCVITIIYAVLSENNKNILGYRLFIVKTGSMQGTLEVGDLIVTKKTNKDKLKVGTVITFISSDPEIFGKVNTHRIIGIEDGKYYTQGDSPESVPDKEPVKFGDIIGELAFKSVVAGKIITFFENPLMMFVFLIMPTIAMFYSETKNGKKLFNKIFRRNKKARTADDIENEILDLLVKSKSKKASAEKAQAKLNNEKLMNDVFSVLSKEIDIEKFMKKIQLPNTKC